MTGAERRVTAVLASLISARMLGLFMLLPVLALYAADMGAAAPILIGLAVGVYGVTQASLQIPLGILSDRIGRRPVIVAGLIVFALGSVAAAMAESVQGLILGRALQGAGAISASVMALLADHTRSAIRTRAMAVIGVSIGASFILSLVLGPVISYWIGVDGLFWLTALLALVVLVVFLTTVRDAPRANQRPMDRGALKRAVADRRLLGMDFGIFILHLMLTATFVAIPFALREMVGLAVQEHWKVYLGVMLVSLAGTIPLIVASERGPPRPVIVLAVATLIAAQIVLARSHASLGGVLAGLWLFFAAFNFLEARLPALLSQMVPDQQRGAALGVFASAQFLGAFAGGIAAGWVLGEAGIGSVFVLCAGAASVWGLSLIAVKL